MVYALEGMRGMAALAVALFHGWPALVTAPFGQAWLCVDMFFVISGFVMSHAYGEHLSTGSDVASFAIRRFGRLYPLHLATLIAYIACTLALQAVKPIASAFGYATNAMNLDLIEGWSLLYNLLLVHGMGLRGDLVYNNASWSISTEIWAYVLFGATVFFLRGRVRIAAWAALAALGLIVLASARDLGNVNSGIYFFRCLYGFFLGALLPLLQQQGRRPSATFLTVLQAVAVATTLAVFAAAGRFPQMLYVGPAVFALLVYSLSFDAGPIAGVLRLRPFQLLGSLSYSVYLTHGVLLIFFNPLGQHLPEPYSSLLKGVYVVTLFGMSMLTFHWIEDPWRRRFQSYSKRLSWQPEPAAAQT